VKQGYREDQFWSFSKSTVGFPRLEKESRYASYYVNEFQQSENRYSGVVVQASRSAVLEPARLEESLSAFGQYFQVEESRPASLASGS
jgi:hypothetical protein